MPAKNPFGEDDLPGRRVNPFGDDEDPRADPVRRLEVAAVKVRTLKNQLGAEGLPLAATRELMDEIAHAFDAVARALRKQNR